MSDDPRPPGVPTYLDDFGIDHRTISAFSRQGLWDDDPSEHLNVHSSHQIIAVEDGMILIADGREKRPVYRHMAALIPAGMMHRAETLRAGESARCHSLFVNPELFRAPGDGICIFQTSELCQALLKKLDERNLVDLSGGILGNCLSLFLALLPEELTRTARPIRLPAAVSARTRAVVSYLRCNYGEPIAVDDLTEVVPLSVRQICRTFRAETGVTIMEYLRAFRMLQASHRLLAGTAKVIDVAQECGYESLSSFHRDFRRHFGRSPDRFRRTGPGSDG